MTDFVYDIEVYPNVFTLTMLNTKNLMSTTYEVSSRHNGFAKMLADLLTIRDRQARMVGFNNLGYDYPVLHTLITKLKTNATAKQVTQLAYQKSCDIINTGKEDKFKHLVWENDHVITQLDLYRIHHFDNVARATSLKVLEFNMRSESIQELPFSPEKPLPEESIDQLIEYNKHDVNETYKFYKLSLKQIQFREALSAKYQRNFLNHNDTKIGKDYFIMQLEKLLALCASQSETKMC